MLLGVSLVYGLFYVFITVFRCGDPTKLADSLLRRSNCKPDAFLLAAGYIYGSINVIADWTFVLIPISVLLDSALDRRAKMSVGLVMALGAVGSISSIIRMVYLSGLFVNETHFSTTSVKATIWATAEPGTGIIAASVAVLRPLFRKIASDVRTNAASPALPDDALAPDSDTIALTSHSKKDVCIHSNQSEHPWGPTAAV